MAARWFQPIACNSILRLSICVFAAFLLLAQPGVAQQLSTTQPKSPDGLWQDVDQRLLLRSSTVDRLPVAQSYRTVRLDVAAFQSLISTAPPEFKASTGLALTLPMPDGRFEKFEIVESSILAPALAAQFPGIKTFSGKSVDNPAFTARLDWTPAGFHAMVIGPGTSMFIEPYDRGDTATYISYLKSQASAGSAFQCLAKPSAKPFALTADALGPLALSSGPILRSYRLALAATGEYTTFHGGTVAAALGAMTTTMNRVNGIWERDFGIRLIMIADEAKIIYTNGTTDPFTNSDSSKAADENQANLDTVIGNANYDVGHVFSTGAGGIGAAGICIAGGKGIGATGHDSPVGGQVRRRICRPRNGAPVQWQPHL